MPEMLVRRGTYAWMPPLPAIPGIELSGTVVERGRNVTSLAIGQAVFVSARDLPERAGCYPEYIAVPTPPPHPLPPGPHPQAAALMTTTRAAGAAGPAVLFFPMRPFDARRAIRAETMHPLLGHFAAGATKPLIPDRLPLREAARAHEIFERGEVIGKLLLKP